MFRSFEILHQARILFTCRLLSTSSKEQQNTFVSRVVTGFHVLKSETKKFLKEQKDHIFSGHKPFLTNHNEVDVIWKFDNTLSCDEWIVTCDSDFNQGFSKASFIRSTGSTGIFSGTLNTQLPKDGKIRKAGYCNLCAPKYKISFFRERPRNWLRYNYLFLRVRGDGRPYFINIGNAGLFDLNENDLYTYTMYTRGGPYWQDVKIPFSKFVLGSKGRVQDQQCPIDQTQVTTFNITLADMTNGPFKLEIDHIGIGMDWSHFEQCAYEIYKY